MVLSPLAFEVVSPVDATTYCLIFLLFRFTQMVYIYIYIWKGISLIRKDKHSRSQAGQSEVRITVEEIYLVRLCSQGWGSLCSKIFCSALVEIQMRKPGIIFVDMWCHLEAQNRLMWFVLFRIFLLIQMRMNESYLCVVSC